MISPMEGPAEIPEEPAAQGERLSLLFAYLPEVLPLTNSNGLPQLPLDLIPLAEVQIAEAIAPEARETIQAIRRAEVEVKLLASAPPEQVAATSMALGLVNQLVEPVRGEELEQMTPARFDTSVRNAAAFANLTTNQKEQIVSSLRLQGHFVAHVADRTSDLPALAQSDLRIALRSSSQAILEKSDIVLLKDALDVLPSVLKTGQRLVNGVLDTFKLYLSQVSTQLFLVIMVFLLRMEEFPYHPTQGSAISLFTIAIPNILLPFWSSTGTLTREKMLRRMAHFVIPAAVTTGLLALAVFWYFYRQLVFDMVRFGPLDYGKS